MHEFTPYRDRLAEFICQITSSGWRIKVYGISAGSLPLEAELVSEGIRNVVSHLPQPAVSEDRYGVGFLTIHHGMLRNWFLLDWWEKEDILHHKLFSSPLDEPGFITAEPDKSLMACVHELKIVAFESEAWIRTLLCRDDDSDLENYLSLRFGSDPA